MARGLALPDFLGILLHKMGEEMVTFEELANRQRAVAVVGLGYVGLPLAVALARHFEVIGFDINEERVKALSGGEDHTGEVEKDALALAHINYTSDPKMLSNAGVVIVAVPTPIDSYNNPDLGPVRGASRTVGRNLRKGSVVVYESTVYPGVTEEECVPILARESGLEYGKDFTVGYSPERINPGDKVHTLDRVVKVVAGSDDPTSRLLCWLYGTIIEAGVHHAPSIKVAEAAKVIENTQRDLNIALMNELAIIFHRAGIDTRDVLEAAETKWNFLAFQPGLVGGHCIGVDPYYLTYKAQGLGYHPQVILAGRRINDGMGKFVAEMTIKSLCRLSRKPAGARVGILGLTFKENVPDLRNTRVVDILRELEEYGASVLVHDPIADSKEAKREYGITLARLEDMRELDALVVAVAHKEYASFDMCVVRQWFKNPEASVVMDVKGIWKPEAVREAGLTYWRL